MKLPPFLLPGDKVAIISPAGKIDQKIGDCGAALLEQQGFRVIVGEHAFDSAGVFAGTDVSRAADLQRALDDRSVKAIFFSRGGYGSIRTLPLVNWSSFFRKPKWLIGFSDITVFHAFLTNHQIGSVHGVMSAWFGPDGVPSESFLKLMDLLKGSKPEYVLPFHVMNRNGTASGILTGGNLSIIQSLRGTKYDIAPKGKILFIEDINEPHYHLDRMMQNLKTGHVLEQLSGIISGYFTGIKEGDTPYGKTAYEIIREAVDSFHYPVVFGFQAGHEMPNLPLIMGHRISLDVSSEKVLIRTM